MNSNRPQPLGRYRRAPSIVLLSDDDQQQEESTNNLMPTQYATPMVQQEQTQQFTTVTGNFDVTFDFDSPMKSPCGLSQPNYVPYTITALNRIRLSILPMYPHDIKCAEEDEVNNEEDLDVQQVSLLLSNIPTYQLSNHEREQRRPGKHECQFSITEFKINSNSSFILQQYERYYVPILERFHIDLAILDFNYVRLKKFIELCDFSYSRAVPASRASNLTFHLREHEFPQLLEFFLQIDVDLFYMKTCSFRQAQPRQTNEGIFCRTTPQCLYVVHPCGHCLLCTTGGGGGQAYSVAFNLHQKHRFVNGYEAILNCPATCETNNIIYSLTCLCGKYDYLGETSSNLLRRLSSHQCFTHRLIIETLIGEKNAERIWGAKSQEMIRKNTMRLYQHPKYCSGAIQSFLNQNPDYSIFVPMLNNDADDENVYLSSTTTTPPQEQPRADIQKHLNSLPKPPANYKFSNLQIQQQYDFFASQSFKKSTNTNYVVYHSKIIALLPVNTSDLFRRLVHSLLVTHAETNLNVAGHIFTPPHKATLNLNVWCENLTHRRRRPPPPPVPYGSHNVKLK